MDLYISSPYISILFAFIFIIYLSFPSYPVPTLFFPFGLFFIISLCPFLQHLEVFKHDEIIMKIRKFIDGAELAILLAQINIYTCHFVQTPQCTMQGSSGSFVKFSASQNVVDEREKAT
jgi:hypothetical protein